MSSFTDLGTLIGQRINDPNHNEIGVGANSVMEAFTNRVLDDASKLTDCLQHSGVVTGDGTVESFSLPTGNVSYIEILDYSDLALSVITVTINGTAYTQTEGTDWNRGASNTAAATSLAAALNGESGIIASSNGVVITVTADTTKTINSLSTTESATDIVIDNAKVWHILSVTDKTNGLVYLPADRREWQGIRNAIIVNSVTGMYYYNLFGYGSGRLLHILPKVANNTNVTLEFSTTHPKMIYVDGTERPLGLLDEYDPLVIAGVAKIYYDANGDIERADQEFQQYIMEVNRLNREIGINPEIKPEMSSLYRMAALMSQQQRQ